MNFGEVLSRAWQIIWKHKVLWIFGILAGLGAGGGSNGGGGGGTRYSMDQNNFNFGNNFGQNIPWYQVENWFRTNWWIFILLALAFLALIVVIIVLSTFGRIGLARGAWQADEGAEKLGFGRLFAESGPYFWRVFGLNLLIFILWIAVLAILFLPAAAFAALTLGIALVCLGPLLILLCCLLVPLGWAVSVVTEQAVVAITCEDLGLIDGLKRGWQVFRANLGPQVIMFLILGIGGGILRFLIALPAFLIVLPLVGAAIANTNAAWMAGGITSVVMLCIYIPIALVLNGVLTGYTGTAWALTFRRLTGRGLPAPAPVEVVPAE
jgi:hypothetical protein